MSAKRSKGRKAVIIVLTVLISIVIIAVLIAGGKTVRETRPHKIHFNKVYLVSNNKYDGKYLYHLSNNSGKVFILRTETDLRNVFKASEEDEFDLGEQDLTVRATGIETYRTDLSGLTISYKTIVYEYVSE
ncbi:MAG: hypothetical protein E7386_09505 [Ruminococcaceae bacterium]|nr:hypothetical protein [Oscillospiraceae bacterium]